MQTSVSDNEFHAFNGT